MEIDELIQDCLRQNRHSQKEFYQLTCDRLMNISRRYSSDMHEAKDILQNAYIKIFQNLKRFDSRKGNLDAWLTKIVINEALQFLRKRSAVRKNKEEIVQEKTYDLSPTILAKLYSEDLVKVLQKLPDGFRAVFNLHEVEGYSHREISTLMGITESTSRSQLTRAKKMLRELILGDKSLGIC